ncbi:MAG: hypothetical protein NTX84_07830 [Nitrospirae bacterium]|nr:hypothetical protein [Nitrospirota bacterium]
MIKLYVDDCRPCPEGWELARTITDAIRILDSGYVAEVSLDYDAGYLRVGAEGHETVGGETFEAIARFIVRMPPDQRPVVKIHSANSEGARRMAALLRDAGVTVG